MSYEKTNWSSGDVITAEKLNHMEDGIESSDLFIVNITETYDEQSDEYTYTSDKTVNEILAAHEEGKILYANYYNDLIPCNHIEESFITFVSNRVDDNSIGGIAFHFNIDKFGNMQIVQYEAHIRSFMPPNVLVAAYSKINNSYVCNMTSQQLAEWFSAGGTIIARLETSPVSYTNIPLVQYFTSDSVFTFKKFDIEEVDDTTLKITVTSIIHEIDNISVNTTSWEVAAKTSEDLEGK